MKHSFIKKSLILIFVICACVLFGATLFACNDNTTFTLTFVADKAVVDTLHVEAGSRFVAPEAPYKEGFEFDGWYDDPAFGEEAKLAPEEAPAHDATYYAKYVRVVGYKIEYYVQMLNEDRTAVSDRYTTTEVALREGRPGNTIALSDIEGHALEGYVYKHNENEVLSLTLGENESQNVLKVYYDRKFYTVSFDANGGEGEMPAQTYPYGATVSGNFQNEFTREGWRFAGFEGSYEDGTLIPNTAFTIKGNVTFKATWQQSHQNVADANDIIYFDGTNYYRMVGDVRENAVRTYIMSEYGFDEFIFGEGTDDEKICRLYEGEDKFKVGGKEAGTYLQYDYTLGVGDEAYSAYVLSLDGFGTAAFSQILMGGATQGRPGTYSLDDLYDDWVFIYSDTTDSEETPNGFYFDLRDTLPASMPEDAQFDGSFVMHGYESGEFVEFVISDSEVDDGAILWLYGNGYARIIGYDPETQDYTQLISEGTYYGTENYDNYFGEWYYSPTDESGTEGFRFVLNFIEGGESPVDVYMRYDAQLDVELNGANGGKLHLNGYNGAIYTVGGTSDEMSGAISFVAGSILRFTPDIQGGASIDFDIDLQGGTFSLNTTGLEVENGVLKGYIGTSTVIEIPDDVTEIAADALSYRNTGVNLTVVTIPASVMKIGARAFENWYTLTSVVFEGEQPISGIDWSDENSPFRWPMRGAFKIYVPDDALEAYKAAWTDCPYKITSVAAENDKPEFEIDDNGVLISYNCKTEDPVNLSIVLPDDVLSVADGVFAYITYISSVDLNNAMEIGTSAFEGCSGLVSVKADKLEVIGEAAFALCTSLESITLPAAKELGAQAFAACEKLEKASVGAGIQRIGDRAFSECATVELSTLFILELADGADVPVMGDDIFHGCFGFRVSVATVDDALALYDGSGRGWNKYAGRATVRANEKSAIAGEWIDIVTLHAATVGGRLETANSAYIYALDGEALTLHYYSYSEVSGGVSRGTLNGTYKDGRISFEDDGESYVLVRRTGKQTYATAEGETLVIDLDSYNVEEIPDSEGYAPMTRTTVGATFEGQAGLITVTGDELIIYGIVLDNVTIEKYQYNNIKCNITLTLASDGGFAYATTMNDARGPYTASDGSYISVEYYGDGRYLYSSVCMTGCIKQFRSQSGGDIVVETRGTWQVIELPSDGTYVFSYNYLNDLYYVTVTLDEPSMTFTYSAEKAASRVVLNGNNGGRVVVLLDKDNKTILSLSLMLQGDDGADTLYVRAFTLQADGSYLAEAEQREMVYDPATGTYVEQLGSLSGVYVLTLDFAKGTCTIVYQGKLDA